LFRSLVGQIHLEKNGDFILVPLVGDQKIVFGSAYTEEEVTEKFKKLRVFYNEAMPYAGWLTYKEISLKFEDQIVCKKKETNG
jgi:cell division protein FtsQ